MTEPQTGWAERSARLAHKRVVESRERARRDDRAELVVDANLEDVAELGFVDTTPHDIEEVRHGQVLRAAVNDLQYRLLTADPHADVHGFALERLMTAAGADRVGAYMGRTGADGRAEHVMYAEAVVSPELSLQGSDAAEPEAYEDFVPRLFERLAAGESFGSRTEFLPKRAAGRLAAQGVEAVLLLPLFVGGGFYGFLRLDHCDRANLWSEAETGILVSAAGSISAAIERQQVVAKLVQRSHELAALLASSRSITSSIDYDVVLHEVACAVAEALACPESVIWEYSQQNEMATYRVLYQHDPKPGLAESLLGSTHHIGDYPGGMEAVRAGVVAQQSLSDVDLSAGDRATMTERGETTWLSVPLVYPEEVLGMMVLIETENERRFTPEEVRMATVIGEQAAAALHNARLHRREEDQHRWLAALAEATRVIASRLDRAELLRDVARLATDALLVDGALVYEWDERREAFALRAVAGGSAASESAAAEEARVDAAVADALRCGELVVQLRGDKALTPTTAAHMTAADEQVVVWVPFRMKDETLGAMRLAERSKQRQFAEGELSFARALGEHAAIALNNARLYALIEDQATRDGLTGLANHRHFYDRLAKEFDRARRHNKPMALLMFDIDDFKKLNDTYGHPAGDEVLRLLGRLMNEGLRKGGDLAARYGGEEFCVILPNTTAERIPGGAARTYDCAGAERGGHGASDPGPGREVGHQEGAAALAERLRRRIAACDFPIGPGGVPVHVTVSVGVASFPAGAEQIDELVARADTALYAAKRAGKNRVEVY